MAKKTNKVNEDFLEDVLDCMEEETGVIDVENEEEEVIPVSKAKKNEVKFQDTFDRSFTKVVVKKNPITSREELRSLVRLYYDIQNFRIGAGNRQYQLDKNEEENKTKKKSTTKPNVSFEYATAGLKETEEAISKWIKEYVSNDPIGKWLIATKGIGPILAGGLISYIDITKCQTAGSIWKYAGWEGHRPPKKKGVKLDYNPDFRVLCWKCGESFQKISGVIKDSEGNPVLDEKGNVQYKSLYGGLYAEKLKWYIDKNEAGGFAEAAKTALSEKNITASATKECYESGKLPMAHLISMAKRYAVKIFLSHLFTVWYEYENKKPAPRPFVEVHCGHVHMIEPPHKDILGL